MLDVITIVSEGTPQGWLAQCRTSVQRAAKLAAFSVNLLESPGVPGHIGQAMARSLSLSRAPFVAWVDDDDFVLPNAFACLERHFADEPSAICARELALFANGQLVPAADSRRHHLTAYRREAIAGVPISDEPRTPNVRLLEAVAADAIDELSWVYVWRRYLSPGTKLRRRAP